MPVSSLTRSLVRTLCPAIVLLCALYAHSARAQVVSPGKLANPHAQLEGSKNCKQCHSRRGRVEPSRCLDCHDALADSIKASRGFHASRASSRCGKCHQDHRGRNFDIIRWPTGSAERFNHKTVRYALAGKHGQSKCRDCHKPKFQVASKVKRFPTARRQRTYLGLSKKCASCHDDEHEGRLGDTCQKCHDEKGFAKPPRFDHDDARFTLRGKHKEVECDDCHKKTGRAPEVLFRGLEYKTCANCHEDSHKGAMAGRQPGKKPGKSGKSGKSGKTECKSCHTDAGWTRLIYRKADHSPRRMPLSGGHADPKCAACHGKKVDKRPSTSCASCHKDVHSGRFGQKCNRCHDIDSWRAHPPRERRVPRMRLDTSARLGLTGKQLAKVAFHQKTRFSLEGLHVKVKCAKCHPRSRRGFKKRFQGIKHDACSDCHKDSHAGRFTGTRCRTCHTTDGWPLTTYGVDEHANSKYPLDGSHRGVPCAQCHQSSLPVAYRYRFDDRRCGACHKDRHGGQFAKRLDRARPSRDCAECHRTSAFKDSQFDHDVARLPLRGAHTKTACSSCHRSVASAAGTGENVMYRGMSPECDSCHRDRHEAQFRKPPAVRKCSECHTQTKFRIAKFDHDKKTSYPLTGKHVDARCRGCHFEVTPANSNPVVLYRLQERKCAQCHKNRHASLVDRLRGPSKKRLLRSQQKTTASVDTCERCHSTAAWGEVSNVASFDHSDVGYALRGGHDNLSCERCHTAGRQLTRQCDGCHSDRHEGRLGGECASCHESSSWRATDIRAQHNRTRLPLTGGHALADCTSCHPRDRQAQYIAVPVACVGCHREDYDTPNTHPSHRETGFGIECQECHRPASWSPAFYTHQDFPLRGAHRLTTCTSCHRRDPVPRDCASCHQDDLAQASDPDHTALGFPADCGQCHNESAWRPAPFPMHEQNFPIARGDHSGFACADCHTNPADTTDFTCLAPCHTRSEMDGEHDDVSDYMYESRACLMCHPDGRD